MCTIISLWWSSALITLALHLLCTSHPINTIECTDDFRCIFKSSVMSGGGRRGGEIGICYHYSIFIEYLDCSWGRKRARLQAFDNCPSNSHVKIVSSTLLPTRLGIKNRSSTVTFSFWHSINSICSTRKFYQYFLEKYVIQTIVNGNVPPLFFSGNHAKENRIRRPKWQ